MNSAIADTMPPAHPAAEIFPMLAEDKLAELAEDIREHGQRQAVVMHEGAILDGRNRWRACEMIGARPLTEKWNGEGGSPTDFVLSVNLHRRHLDESQRAMVAGRAKKLFAEEAEQRRLANLKQGTEIPERANLRSREPEPAPPDHVAPAVESRKEKPAPRSWITNEPAAPMRAATNDDAGKAAEKAAALVQVSTRSVEYASKVIEDGVPELAAAVDAGKVAVSTAAVIAEAPKKEQREIVARGEKEILQAAKEIRAAKQETRRQERVEKLVEISKGNAPLLAPQKFPLIYADPPWRYEHVETESRAIENQYPTMSLDEICALDLAKVSTDDCVLFMWATSPKLAESFQVLAAWGFNYRTCAVWVKDKIGMGYYFRQQHELLLVATRGTPPVPGPSDRVSSVLEAVRGKHSAKPEEFYEVIERMYPTLPKQEMFYRNPLGEAKHHRADKGWYGWGNQS